MSGDNTVGQKIERARKRVMIAYMKHLPGYIQEEYFIEFCAVLGQRRNETLEDIIRDSDNYELENKMGYDNLVHKRSISIQCSKATLSLRLEELKIKQKFNNTQV